MVPAFQAVYSQHSPVHVGQVSWPRLLHSDGAGGSDDGAKMAFRASLGRQLVFGQVFGWLEPSELLAPLSRPEFSSELDFLRVVL
eukprot:SAG11_NODE_19056_length_475_cov_0.811170_1_plen_84_part_10